MTAAPVICFGQQPCGFFPKRFLVAKIRTARRLQQDIGGEIVYFCHDSDHDPRETQTILRHRKTSEPAKLNFTFKNRIQRKFSPLYIKQIAVDWQDKTVLQLPNYVGHPLINVFKNVSAPKVADFCLMWRNILWMCPTKAKSSAPDSHLRVVGPTCRSARTRGPSSVALLRRVDGASLPMSAVR
jgi:hypothetical protein